MTHTNRIKKKIHAGIFQQKKELLIAVFVLFNLSVFAQVIEIKGIEVDIDSVLSGSSSYEITARDNITLSPGFSFTPSQGCSLLTEIDPFYTEPVDTGNITGGPGGDIDRFRLFEGGDLDRGAEHYLGELQVKPRVEIIPVPLKEGVPLDLDRNEEVTRGASVNPLPSLSRDAQPGPRVHAAGDLDLNSLLRPDLAGTSTV